MWQAQQIAAIQLAAAAAAAATAVSFQQQHEMMLAMSAPPSYQLQQRPPHLADLSNEISDKEDDEDDEQLRTLFCGNLDERVTEELLYEAFLQVGPLETVRIPRDNSGKQRSFGFVTYSHRCSPPYAMQLLAGLSLYRRTLVIKQQGEPDGGGARRSSLSADYERYLGRHAGNNSILRSNSAAELRDDHKTDIALPPLSNPFRQQSPDWTKGSALRNQRDNDRERISRHATSNMRPHHNSSPYQRHRDESLGKRSDTHDHRRRRDRHGNGEQKPSAAQRRRQRRQRPISNQRR